MSKPANMKNAYEILFERIQPKIKADLSNTKPTSLLDGCDFCLRNKQEIGGDGLVWVDSYGSENHICLTCNMFVEQLHTTLGLERGSIGYKISSIKGAILAVPFDEDKPTEFWLGGKYLDRMTTNGAFKIVDCTGNKAKFELCERIGEFSVVSEISLRREMYLRHIRKSSGNTLFVSGETGVVAINKQEYQRLKAAFIAEDMNNKKLLEVIVTINGLKTNRTDILNNTVQKTLGELKQETRQAISNVVDPSSLLYMLAALRAGLTQKEV